MSLDNLKNEITDNVDQKHPNSYDDFVDHPSESSKKQVKRQRKR